MTKRLHVEVMGGVVSLVEYESIDNMWVPTGRKSSVVEVPDLVGGVFKVFPGAVFPHLYQNIAAVAKGREVAASRARQRLKDELRAEIAAESSSPSLKNNDSFVMPSLPKDKEKGRAKLKEIFQLDDAGLAERFCWLMDHWATVEERAEVCFYDPSFPGWRFKSDVAAVPAAEGADDEAEELEADRIVAQLKAKEQAGLSSFDKMLDGIDI